MADIRNVWWEMQGIEDDPVMAVEADLAKKREDMIKELETVSNKQKGITKPVLDKGVTAMMKPDSVKPVTPIKGTLKEDLFESCDELDEGIFGTVNNNAVSDPVANIDAKKPFNPDDYDSPKEARLAFELYMQKKFPNQVNETLEDNKAICNISGKNCKAYGKNDVTPYEKKFNEEGLKESVEDDDDLGPILPVPKHMWKYQDTEGITESFEYNEGDDVSVGDEPADDINKDDFLFKVTNSMAKDDEDEPELMEESLLTESVADRNKQFIYDWFSNNDTGDWMKAYEQLLQLNSPNALAEFRHLSDSAKAYQAQVEFNKLPNDIINLVDKDVNNIWLTRRKQPKMLDQLQTQLSGEDRQIIPKVGSIASTWANRAKELAGMK